MEAAAVFLPFVGYLIVALFGRGLGDRASMAITTLGVNLALAASILVFIDVVGEGGPRTVTLFTWMASGDFQVDWALKVDTLTAIMLLVVNGVSAMVHIYSIGYMSHDKAKPRFFAYLSLFTFMMLMLVTADNLVQLYFGWEGVGLASYLLIGFWHERPSASTAAIKAFVVNRVGDFGFALGIMGVFLLTGSVEFSVIFERIPELADTTFGFLGMEVHALTCVCLLLFLGAMGKSAQLGLHTWLPDAMEGPTPVSALIHAATMVTAGVFMVARLSPMFELAPLALMVVCLVGALTAVVAATIGLTQFDIKRVIAYSTMSQLGYMFFAAGVGAYNAAIFHLMTHAAFKSLLFLGAGSVIHAMSDEQDMRKMGGIASMVPYTYTFMWIGSLALAGVGVVGVFGFAGFYSKDLILESAFAAHGQIASLAFWLGIAAAFMTAFYSWRLLFLTFHGAPRADEKVMAHVHESPPVMLIPLGILAVGSIFLGIAAYDAFAGYGMEAFWGDSIAPAAFAITEEAHHVPYWVKWLPLIVGLAGIALAWIYYIRMPGLGPRTAATFAPIDRLFARKWYFDELYDFVFVRGALAAGRGLWKGGDGAVIDGLGPDGLAAMTQALAARASRLQSGYIYHYAFAMLIGVVCLVTWYFFAVGA